jgi:hypothetical protein
MLLSIFIANQEEKISAFRSKKGCEIGARGGSYTIQCIDYTFQWIYHQTVEELAHWQVSFSWKSGSNHHQGRCATISINFDNPSKTDSIQA